MNNLTCPICETKLLDHGQTDCMNAWIAETMGWTCRNGIWLDVEGKARELPWWVEQDSDALEVMEWIWEKDNGATISKCDSWYRVYCDQFKVDYLSKSLSMSICQAAIWLKSQI